MLRNNQNIIRVVGAFIIAFCHLAWVISDLDSIFLYFCNFGYLAVGIFFFFSGYNLVYNYREKEDYLKGFIIKKITRVLIPYVIVGSLLGVLVVATKIVDASEMNLKRLILENGLLWYIPAIFILYMAFYIIFSLYGLLVKSAGTKTSGLLLIPVILTVSVYAVVWHFVGGFLQLPATIHEALPICLVVGMIVPIVEEKISGIIKKFRWELFFASLLAAYVTHTKNIRPFEGNFDYWAYMAPLFTALTLILLFSFADRIESKALGFLGSITLETYLFHYFAMRIFRNEVFFVDDNKVYMVLYLGTLILLSAGFHYGYGYILKRFKMGGKS